MDSVPQSTAAVTPPRAAAYRTGFIVGRLILAACALAALTVVAVFALHQAQAAQRAAQAPLVVTAPQDVPTATQAALQAAPRLPAGTDAVLAPLMNATGYDALRNSAVLGISADAYVRAQGFDAPMGQTVTPNPDLIYWAVARYARTTLQGQPIDVVETVLTQTLDVDYSAMTPADAYVWTQHLMGPVQG